ncbi:MAG: hypothetical protein IPL05_05435 [Betaproteobacteria bacterium]|nr:hypothetical protein [Betaproteobacteria bacterium]
MTCSPTTFMPMIWPPACLAALRHAGANRAYNVVDDSDPWANGEYFDRVARTAFDLPKPPRISRQEASGNV